MSETATTYLLSDPKTPVPMDRDAFYQEQIEICERGGEPTRAIEVIAVLIFNKERDIILQKRSHQKFHNPYLIDKTIGGHIKYDDAPFYTVMVETVQELRVPSIVLRSTDDFKKTYDLLYNYLDNIAVIRELDQGMFELKRIIGGKVYPIMHKVHLFIGVYGGATKPVDREASGTLYYSLNYLKDEMKAIPDHFTDDLALYLDRYQKEIDSFLAALR